MVFVSVLVFYVVLFCFLPSLDGRLECEKGIGGLSQLRATPWAAPPAPTPAGECKGREGQGSTRVSAHPPPEVNPGVWPNPPPKYRSFVPCFIYADSTWPLFLYLC